MGDKVQRLVGTGHTGYEGHKENFGYQRVSGGWVGWQEEPWRGQMKLKSGGLSGGVSL